MLLEPVRAKLPRPSDRLPLGRSGLLVSPFCLGMTANPDTVIKAYESGVNFFFITADLHWPLYENLRRGIGKLVQGNKARRDQLVIAVVSYLENPLFSALQFHEVIGAVAGLDRVDLMLAGAVSGEQSFYSRVESLHRARSNAHCGARAIGATFHQRRLALNADYEGLLDIAYVRYNSAHPGARTELFPWLRPRRAMPLFNFKSTMSQVTKETFDSLRLPPSCPLPDICDYYRFVLSRPEIDGLLFSPLEPAELDGVIRSLDKGPVSAADQEYMIWLSSLVHANVMA